MIIPSASQHAKNDQLQTLQFNSDDYRPADRIDAMNEFSRGLYEYTRFDGQPAQNESATDPMLRLKAWSLDGISAASFENSPIVAKSLGQKDSSFDDQLFLRIIKAGSVPAESNGTEALLLPGSIHFMHTQNHLRPSETGSVASLRFSYSSIGYDPGRHPRFMSFSTDAWIGRTAESAVKTLFEALPTMTVEEAMSAEPMITGLVRALLSSGPIDEQAHDAVVCARTNAMRRYILAHLGDDELDSRRLQVVFKASRATVYRAFEDVGGVARFVREARLKAVYRELLEMTPERGAIRRISEKYGLWDQSSFIRSFRSFFGVRPSEIMGSSPELYVANQPQTDSRVEIDGPTLASFWS
ncbi:MAG: AraC family transcriptional regulator [Pseudomonadota bacterium]